MVKKAHNLIEDTWVRIRKKEVDLLTPTFTRKISEKQITLSPLYHGNNRSIVLQVDNARGYQKITVDRFAENFTYEKVVKTEFGSATIASYNSKTSQKNESYTSIVNELLEDYLPKFVKQPPNPNL